jgi:DNA-binding NarL/FixJ family response regulator
MEQIKIMIVDDHQMMLDGIVSLLQNETHIQVIGKAASAKEMLQLLELNPPDVLITDIHMPQMNGTELTQKVRAYYPSVKIIALSMHNEASMITEMIQAGVSGYILKNTGKEELITAIEKVFSGGVYYSREVGEQMMQSLSGKKDEQKELRLTERELQIVKLIAKELTNAQIGDQLFISERTVESHRKNILRKSNTKTVIGLIKYAIDNKLLD